MIQNLISEPGYFHDCDALVRSLQGKLDMLFTAAQYDETDPGHQYNDISEVPSRLTQESNPGNNTDSADHLAQRLKKQNLADETSVSEQAKQNRCSTCDDIIGDALSIIKVTSLKETIVRKDDEIEELQLKSIKVGPSSGTKTLKHSMSSPGIASPSRQFSPQLSSGKVTKFSERASSDQESSEFSDRQSESSSQQSGENSEGRQSDTNVSNLVEKTKDKM